MKKIELNGLDGLFIEIYDKHGNFTEIQLMKEAEKTIRRAVLHLENGGIRYESRINLGANRPDADNKLPKHP